MKHFAKFFLIISTVFLLAGLLSPVIYRLLPFFKFERIFNRLVMIFGLLAAGLFVRVRKQTLVAYGLEWTRRTPFYFAASYFAGLVALGIAILIQMKMGAAAWDPAAFSRLAWTGKLLLFLGAGLLVGILEEFFFRGFVFRELVRLSMPVAAAVVLTSLLYAVIHFSGQRSVFIDSTPTFRDSLRLMVLPFRSLADWPSYWPHALGLFFFGLVLNDLVFRTHSLYPAIGLHAGGVFFLKLDGNLVDLLRRDSLFLGSGELIDGVMGWMALGSCWIVLRILFRETTKTKVEHHVS